MAQNIPTTFTPPAASVYTELYYATSENPSGSGLTQIFGVQAVPPPVTSKEDITYRTLESDMEYAVKGVRPYEPIELECIWYTEQYDALDDLAELDEELWFFLKLPASQKTVFKWRGSIDISPAEIALDDMLKTVIKLGKSIKPIKLKTLPA